MSSPLQSPAESLTYERCSVCLCGIEYERSSKQDFSWFFGNWRKSPGYFWDGLFVNFSYPWTLCPHPRTGQACVVEWASTQRIAGAALLGCFLPDTAFNTLHTFPNLAHPHNHRVGSAVTIEGNREVKQPDRACTIRVLVITPEDLFPHLQNESVSGL